MGATPSDGQLTGNRIAALLRVVKGEQEEDKHSRCGGGQDKIERLCQPAGGGGGAKTHKEEEIISEEMTNVEFTEKTTKINLAARKVSLALCKAS